MKKKEKQILLLLAAVLCLTAACCGLALRKGRRVPTPYYESQVRAARQLAGCFRAVKGYRQELDIPLSPEDWHETGMIGEPWTGITTTLGAVEAKRTTAWPDMAALCVRLLQEAGLEPGDTVGAGFSGSFPAMNLALVTACESLDLRLVCISSVGASTYGANNPLLTFPEMLQRLGRDGLIETASAAVTLGGYQDVGLDMDPELAAQIRRRLQAWGLLLIEEPDFRRDIAFREELYLNQGPIDCFVAVGGNVTSLGLGESGISLGQGLLEPAASRRAGRDAGLVRRYLARGLPVINLLNIKKLTADYGLPYDPPVWPPVGQSAVYYEIRYPRAWLAAGLAGAVILLLLCGYIRHRPHPEAAPEQKDHFA